MKKRHPVGANPSDERYTPPEIFDALGLTFDLDPCSPGKGHWVPLSSSATRTKCLIGSTRSTQAPILARWTPRKFSTEEKIMTSPQRRFIQAIEEWGEWSPDMEDEIGCSGAALRAVESACERRGWIVIHAKGGIEVTNAGREALKTD